MSTLKLSDFDEWLKACLDKVPLATWGPDHTTVAVMFANDAIKSLQLLIADICIHEHTRAHNRYASTKDENDMVDQLNDRILVALGEDAATTLPTEEGTDGVQSDAGANRSDAGGSGPIEKTSH